MVDIVIEAPKASRAQVWKYEGFFPFVNEEW